MVSSGSWSCGCALAAAAVRCGGAVVVVVVVVVAVVVTLPSSFAALSVDGEEDGDDIVLLSLVYREPSARMLTKSQFSNFSLSKTTYVRDR